MQSYVHSRPEMYRQLSFDVASVVASMEAGGMFVTEAAVTDQLKQKREYSRKPVVSRTFAPYFSQFSHPDGVPPAPALSEAPEEGCAVDIGQKISNWCRDSVRGHTRCRIEHEEVPCCGWEW